MIVLFFSREVANVIRDLRECEKLRIFARVAEAPDAEQVYEFLSAQRTQFVSFLNGVLGSVCFRSARSPVKIVDSTSLILDLNLFREQKISYKWGYSPGKGYYKGYKLVLVVEYPSLKLVAFYLYKGSPYDSKLFLEIVGDLRRRMALRNGDRIIADKGFCDDENYWKCIMLHKVEPCIFPKKNHKNLKRLHDKLFRSFDRNNNFSRFQ